MRFLFWNTHSNSIDSYIASIITEQNIDVFCGAEYFGDDAELCNRIGDKSFERIITPGCDRIAIFGDSKLFSTGFQNSYCSMQFVNDDYLLCVVHLPSKLYDGNKRREIQIREIVKEIELFEDKKGIVNTIVVGDLNTNPYEESCLSVDQFHSIPIEYEARRGVRIFADQEYKMFYNPMWNLLGDKNYPPGTYYANKGPVCPYWNIYDQVIIRPSLISRFKKSQLRIITDCENGSLVGDNNHPRKEISDHLPIVFELED